MVEGCILPIGWDVTSLTLGSIAPIMFVVISVARIAIFGRAFEDIVHMAFFASDLSMLTFEFECGKIVVELRIFPGRGIMATLALSSILTVMFIIWSMAGITILRRRLQINNGARVQMALGTSCIGVTTFELKGVGIVVEIIKPIHTIVAG